MRRASGLREVRDALLALSDPDLLLLLQQWIETSYVINVNTAQTVEEGIENLLCLRLGYCILTASKHYPSFTAYFEAEDEEFGTLCPPTPQELRVSLTALSLNDFNSIVGACAFSISLPRGAQPYDQPTRDDLTCLAEAIRENTILDRGRPRCLFYCFGYQLGLRMADSSTFSDAERDALLHQMWQNYRPISVFLTVGYNVRYK